jgi:hypothetical protein
MRWIQLLAIAALVLATSGCDKLRGNSSGSGETKAAPGPRAALEIAMGADRFSLAPSSKGYALSGGSLQGKVKIESDRIKLMREDGTQLAKVKQKDSGFKLYDGSEAEVLKAKHRGAGFKLSRGDAELGKLDATGGSAGGSTIAVKKDGERWVVTRDGTEVGSANGAVSGLAASFLGLTELSLEQRLAMLLYQHEVAR